MTVETRPWGIQVESVPQVSDLFGRMQRFHFAVLYAGRDDKLRIPITLNDKGETEEGLYFTRFTDNDYKTEYIIFHFTGEGIEKYSVSEDTAQYSFGSYNEVKRPSVESKIIDGGELLPLVPLIEGFEVNSQKPVLTG